MTNTEKGAEDVGASASGAFNMGPSAGLWDWQTGDHCEPRDGNHDATQFLWDCLNQDDDELLGLLGNRTPLRDYCDFFADLGDIIYKETLDLEESRESKRRCTLEHPSESSQPEVASHETGSPFVTSEVAEVSLLCTNAESLNCDMQYTSNNLDTINSVSNEAPYEQEDNHLEHCSYGTPVYIEPDQVPCSRESIGYIDDQAGINQRIHAPPKKALEILETSAFSGKPVIGKTTIRTEGGERQHHNSNNKGLTSSLGV